jgi:hypothetical protein
MIVIVSSHHLKNNNIHCAHTVLGWISILECETLVIHRDMVEIMVSLCNGRGTFLTSWVVLLGHVSGPAGAT